MFCSHTDHLNTPRLITNQTGQAVWRYDNIDPFGGNVPDENPSGLGNFTCNLRLPGQYFDKETNNHYNMMRDYDPAIGRYIQSDPIGLQGGINTYLYAFDPLTEIDPLGLMGVGPGGASKSGLPNAGRIRSPDICPHRGETCKLLRKYGYDICYVFADTNVQRNAGAWNDPILRPIENFSYAACYGDVTTVGVLIHQFTKPARPGTTPFSRCALDAGMLGVTFQGKRPTDWKKWCGDDC